MSRWQPIEGRSCGRSKGVGPSGCLQRPTGNRRRPWRQRSRRLLGGSGVSREAPAPFCERPEVKLLRPTRHESFNVLKTKGYYLAHNFGHGKEHLSAVLATLNLIVFAIHTLCDLAAGSWRQAVATVGARMRFFQRMRAITAYLIFPSWGPPARNARLRQSRAPATLSQLTQKPRRYTQPGKITRNDKMRTAAP